jgi:hypothetical protein
MSAIPTWLQRQRTVWPPLRMALALFGLPVVLVGVAYIPGLNAVVFSGHGGPGWLALALCFPVLLVNAYRWIVRRGPGSRKSRWRRFAAISLAYLVFAYPAAVFAEYRITKDSGLPIRDRAFYRMMTLPIGLVVPAWPTTR